MRFKITLEYDGSRYAGWQLQKNAKSIQGELLEKAFQIFDTQQVEIYGAGRTDTGVHARGQVIHLDVATQLQTEQIKARFNDALPIDINILSVEAAHPKFHARHDARYRTYIYQISKRRDAFDKKYTWWVKEPLDVALMRQAAALLVGFHDFRSFGEADKKDAKSTLVEMAQLDLTETADRIEVCLKGSHFLWRMVRRIVGVLVEVGRGQLPIEAVQGYLLTPSREPALFTAPAQGLFLEKIEY